MSIQIAPLPWQSVVLGLRGHVDLIILAGGRGGGKTTCALLALTAHCIELGHFAAPILVRESWAGLSESMQRAYEFCASVFGPRTSYNRSEAVIRLPNGGIIYGLSLHEGESAYVRIQGKNLTAVIAEECGVLKGPQFVFMRRLESNLRPPIGFQPLRIWACNPGGAAHTTLLRNWISKTPPWKIARDHLGLSYVWCPSVYTDNVHIDAKGYKKNLVASVGADHALAEAWLSGLWANISAAMFPMNPEVHLIEAIPPSYLRGRAKFVAGSDWGSSAPATAMLIAQLREPLTLHGRRLPYGSIIAVDETSTVVDPHDRDTGSGLDPRSFGEQIFTMLDKWGAAKCDVWADDAKGLKGDTVLDYYRHAGLNAALPYKANRVAGWDLIRQHLAYTETRKGPPLYFTTQVPLLWDDLSDMPRGQLNPRDADPKYGGHFSDGFRYGMQEIAGGPRSSQGTVVGAW